MMLAVILTGLFFVFLLVLPTALHPHAVLQVISIFRDRRALSSNSAKTVEELGLAPAGFAKQLISFRDYKPKALRGLIKAGIVQVTSDGKLFLSEDKMADLSPIKH